MIDQKRISLIKEYREVAARNKTIVGIYRVFGSVSDEPVGKYCQVGSMEKIKYLFATTAEYQFLDDVEYGRLYFISKYLVWLPYSKLVGLKDRKGKRLCEMETLVWRSTMLHRDRGYAIIQMDDVKRICFDEERMKILLLDCCSEYVKEISFSHGYPNDKCLEMKKLWKECTGGTNLLEDNVIEINAEKMRENRIEKFHFHLSNDEGRIAQDILKKPRESVTDDQEVKICDYDSCRESVKIQDLNVKKVRYLSIFAQTPGACVKALTKCGNYKFFCKNTRELTLIEVPRGMKGEIIRKMRKRGMDVSIETTGSDISETVEIDDEFFDHSENSGRVLKKFELDDAIVESKEDNKVIQRWVDFMDHFKKDIPWFQPWLQKINPIDIGKKRQSIVHEGVYTLTTLFYYFVFRRMGKPHKVSLESAIRTDTLPTFFQGCKALLKVKEEKETSVSGRFKVMSSICLEGLSESLSKQPLQTVGKAVLTSLFNIIPLNLSLSMVTHNIFTSVVFGGFSAGVTGALFTSLETAYFCNQFKRKKISKSQLGRNITEAVTSNGVSAFCSAGGGVIGSLGGGIFGTMISPVFGTILGTVAGFVVGAVGGIGGGLITRLIHHRINDELFSSDKKRTQEVFRKVVLNVSKRCFLCVRGWKLIFERIKHKDIHQRIFSAGVEEKQKKVCVKIIKEYVAESWKKVDLIEVLEEREYVDHDGLKILRKNAKCILKIE